jgi:hypothetical protein
MNSIGFMAFVHTISKGLMTDMIQGLAPSCAVLPGVNVISPAGSWAVSGSDPAAAR